MHLQKSSLQRCDVLVIGAGPAGIASVGALLKGGLSVCWVDTQARAGGQVWRGEGLGRHTEPDFLAHPQLCYLSQSSVIGGDTAQLLVSSPTGTTKVQAKSVVLATGARERFVAMPGWTLPGVTGAGGLQALIKGGWPVKDQQVVFAGSGPLLLAAASTARAAGAKVRLIAEQASPWSVTKFALQLPPGKMLQALKLRRDLAGVPYRLACWPVRILGQTQVEGVELTNGCLTWVEPCDALAMGFGLMPNLELARLLGCVTGPHGVVVDAHFETSQKRVYAIGEANGIGGVDKASLEGRMVALHLLGQQHEFDKLRGKHRHALRFVDRLRNSFAWRDELLQLAEPDTLICRCEDVAFSALKPHDSWRSAKLHTRCGMGSCQGRICAPIANALCGWSDSSGQRPPACPVKAHHLL